MQKGNKQAVADKMPTKPKPDETIKKGPGAPVVGEIPPKVKLEVKDTKNQGDDLDTDEDADGGIDGPTRDPKLASPMFNDRKKTSNR